MAVLRVRLHPVCPGPPHLCLPRSPPAGRHHPRLPDPQSQDPHSERLQVRHGSHIHLQYSTGGDSAHHLHSEGLHQHLCCYILGRGHPTRHFLSRPQFHSKGEL